LKIINKAPLIMIILYIVNHYF